MIKLNDDLLRELGLDGLPIEEKKSMLAHIYETLEMRVGMKLAQQMSDEQLDEFEQFIKGNDEAGALHWLETKFPHYKDVVSAEFENLKMEIRQVAPQILTSSAAHAGASPFAGQPQFQQPLPANQQPQIQPAYFAPPTAPSSPSAFQPSQQQPWPQQSPPPAPTVAMTHPQQPWPVQPPQPVMPSPQQSVQDSAYRGGYDQQQLQQPFGGPQQPQYQVSTPPIPPNTAAQHVQPSMPVGGQGQSQSYSPVQQPPTQSTPTTTTPLWPQTDQTQQQPPMAA